ncbi:MAG: NTP transferase domain-containing protein, partial [Candidatus Izemoplasmatales bacterium]|nr:NTP transferase domain-containing protein [Candidatus Izemoplasmatales bacterium]
MKKYAIILAAGKGTRMKTELPKCAYPLLRKPMIAYIVENIHHTHIIDDIIVVVGHKAQVIKDILGDTVKYAFQEEQLGTGHAVMVAEPLVTDLDGASVILPGDMPLVDTATIEKAF